MAQQTIYGQVHSVDQSDHKIKMVGEKETRNVSRFTKRMTTYPKPGDFVILLLDDRDFVMAWEPAQPELPPFTMSSTPTPTTPTPLPSFSVRGSIEEDMARHDQSWLREVALREAVNVVKSVTSIGTTPRSVLDVAEQFEAWLTRP